MEDEPEVKTFIDRETSELLIDDGHAKLLLSKDIGVEGAFGFAAVDDGGFTGVIATPQEWEEMKKKVDAFLATWKN